MAPGWLRMVRPLRRIRAHPRGTAQRAVPQPCRGHIREAGRTALKHLWGGQAPYLPHEYLPNGPAYRVLEIESTLRAQSVSGILIDECDVVKSDQEVENTLVSTGERTRLARDLRNA